VRVVVTHGGHGTVTAALACGVPLVCLPNRTSDQPALAAQLAALGAGVALDGDATTPEDIRAAVATVLSDASYATAARRLAAMISDAQSAAASVSMLERVTGPGPAGVVPPLHRAPLTR
jgi:UDP:flavonoid glycosyltransferase YjiC (YdhE family)